ncbi:MAG: ferredoxin family protein [Armatimonadota bacterium]
MPWLAGIPREDVKWHPTIDPARCVRCGMCMNCGRKVFEWTDTGPVVTRPNECIVGCSTCATLCQAQCITFPDPDELRALYRKNRVWAAVKQKLQEEGVIPTS